MDPRASVHTNFCDSCQYAFRTPFLSDEGLAKLYDGYRGAEYNARRLAVEPGYIAQIQMLSDRSHSYWKERLAFYDAAISELRGLTGLVVDFGGGDGFFTRHAFPEASIEVVEEDYERKGGDLDALLAQTDLLFSAQVFEHIPQPTRTLSRLARPLRPGARAWIDVPLDFVGPPGEDFARLQAQQEAGVLGWTSSVVIYHEHVGNFSPRSLRVLLRRSGFELEELVLSPLTLGILARRTTEPVGEA